MERTEIVSAFRKKFFGLALTIGAASFVMAQQKVNVSGNIKDSNGGVGYASITFKNQQNAQLSDATLADVNGNYKLQLVPGSYEVSIEAVDYKQFNQTIRVEKAGPIAPFVIMSEGKANLNNTTDIQGVVITATSTKPYKVELDKRTYDPSQDVISKGGNLQDVLTNVPSVAVDPDGTVSMRGSSNVRFLINGKPSSLLGIDSGSNALQSIPADQIERIEVITNPSSKFEASGTAGILNIILKKSKGRGFNGSVEGTLGYLPTTRLNTNLSWRKGNWTWYINGGGGYNQRKNTRENNTRYLDNFGNTTSLLNQTNDNKNIGNNYNFNSGFTVDLTEKTSLNVGGMIRYNTNDSEDSVNYFSNDLVKSLQSTSNRFSDGNGRGTSMQGDLGIDHKFNTNGHNLSASVSFQRNKSNDDNNIRETLENVFVSRNLVDQETVNKTIIGKLDYELPVGENSKLEAGYRFDRNENDYDYFVTKSTNDIDFSVVPNFTSNTVYKEMFNAFYAQFRSKINRFGYQLGLRTEISNIDVDFSSLSLGSSAPISKNYTGLFPSVFLSYDLGGDNSNQLLLNYSRRINRPRSWFLIPFNSFNLNDDRNLFAGNPDLNPEYVNSFELGYAIQKKKFTINPTIYLRRTQDETQMVVVRENPNSEILQTRPYNVGSQTNIGLDVNATADILPWWKIIASLDLFRYQTKGSFFDPNLMNEPRSFDGKGFSARTRLTNTFKLDKTTNIQIQGFFRGAEKTASDERKANYVVNFGANKTIWKGSGTIAFNIQDIFNSRAMERYSYGGDFERYSYMQWQPRQFSVSLTYRFKQGEKVEQPKRKKDINANDNSGDDQGPM